RLHLQDRRFFHRTLDRVRGPLDFGNDLLRRFDDLAATPVAHAQRQDLPVESFHHVLDRSGVRATEAVDRLARVTDRADPAVRLDRSHGELDLARVEILGLVYEYTVELPLTKIE